MRPLPEPEHSSHSFLTGSLVRLSRRYPPRKAGAWAIPRRRSASPAGWTTPQYRIKSGCEPFYRTVTENELESDEGATATVAAS